MESATPLIVSFSILTIVFVALFLTLVILAFRFLRAQSASMTEYLRSREAQLVTDSETNLEQSALVFRELLTDHRQSLAQEAASVQAQQSQWLQSQQSLLLQTMTQVQTNSQTGSLALIRALTSTIDRTIATVAAADPIAYQMLQATQPVEATGDFEPYTSADSMFTDEYYARLEEQERAEALIRSMGGVSAGG